MVLKMLFNQYIRTERFYFFVVVVNVYRVISFQNTHSFTEKKKTLTNKEK